MSGWNILFIGLALVVALLGMLFPEFGVALRGPGGAACPASVQITPSLALVLAPVGLRLMRHARKMSVAEYVVLGLALAPFALGLILGDCLSLAATLGARNVPFVLILFCVLALAAVAARLGSEDACRLPARRRR